MKIGFFGVSEPAEMDFFKQQLPDHELVFVKDPLTLDNLPEKDFEILSVFVKCQITPELISALPSLKAIFARSTGFDNIDIAAAKAKNIAVYNVPAYGSHTVAEFAFGLMLAFCRKIPQGVNRTKIEKKFSYEGLTGQDLNGKTLGVVGTGKIGTNVIKAALGFGMKVVACDAFPNKELAESLDFSYLLLEGLLQTADIITIHVPATKETNHMLNSGNMHFIKPGAVLINTSRGSVIETDSLVEALKSGKLSGAALDVIENEEDYQDSLANNKLVDLPNVIITPHMAFDSVEAIQTIRQITVDNIKNFLQGKTDNQVK